MMHKQDLSEQIARLRREYASQGLDENSVAADPIVQFQNWFKNAVEAGQVDPEAMMLSTVNSQGRPSGRVVLLKRCDEHGFVFFTNYDSRKSREMIAHPQVALTFYWPVIHRQVRIEGVAQKVPAKESEEYFKTRPRGSQLGAWASPQSEIINSRDMLEKRLAEIEERFADQAIPCPTFWGGFRVKPDMIEFWQGRENRLHDRILYTLQDGRWQICRLAP